MMNDRIHRRREGRWFILAAAFSWIASIPAGARADLIKYQYGGVITSADPTTGISPGTRFSGTISYDTDAGSPPDPRWPGTRQYNFGGYYYFPSSLTPPSSDSGLTISVGGQPIGPTQGGLFLALSHSRKSLSLPAGAPNPETAVEIATGGANQNPIRIVMGFKNSSPAATFPLDLPKTINLSDFTSTFLNVDDASGPLGLHDLYRGTIDTLTPIPTPEPSAALLLGIAAAARLARSRCRRA